jgi:hypothetical protein
MVKQTSLEEQAHLLESAGKTASPWVYGMRYSLHAKELMKCVQEALTKLNTV